MARNTARRDGDAVRGVILRARALSRTGVVLARISALSRNPEASPVTLSRAIAVDPVFCEGVVQAVRSGWAGPPAKRPVTDIHSAMLAASAGVVVRTALLVALAQISADLMRGRAVTALSFVQQAVGSAHVAETLAGSLKVSPINGFMVGALSRIGFPVTAYALAASHDALMRGVSGSSSPPQEAERGALGFSHLDVGRELVHQFELPEVVGQATAAGGPGAPAPARLREASWMVLEQMGFHLGLANVPAELSLPEQRALGLTEPTIMALADWIAGAAGRVEESWPRVVHEDR